MKLKQVLSSSINTVVVVVIKVLILSINQTTNMVEFSSNLWEKNATESYLPTHTQQFGT
jgi:hypothetical protein